MSTNFLTPLVIEPVDDSERVWRILEEFKYVATVGTTSWTITVPNGFVTDFASIPRLFWAILPPTGRYGKAAVIHDYLYNAANITIPGTKTILVKAMVDKIFLAAMTELGVPSWQRYPMYYAVRKFGKGNFGNYGVYRDNQPNGSTRDKSGSSTN